MRPTAAVLSVGNEVLRGSVVNTNAAFLGKELSSFGFDMVAHVVCADDEDVISAKLRELIKQANLVIVCGGLGPTPDDVTRQGIAACFSEPLIFSKLQFSRLKNLYKKFRKKVPSLVSRETYYPRNAQPLLNRFGVALGFSVSTQGGLVIALPGVPVELKNMYVDIVLPLLKKRFPKVQAARCLIVRMAGISEPEVMKRFGKDLFTDSFDFGIYPMPGEVLIRILCDRQSVFLRLKKKINRRLGDRIFCWDDKPLTRVVGDLLKKKKKTLAVAESCTGGLLASEISSVPGASQYFKGGTVTYHRTVKEELGVPGNMIAKFGEVSSRVTCALAEAVRKRMNSDYGIGVTGIAGPGGGTRLI